MLVYLEYISRRPGVGLHEFHKIAGAGPLGWSGDFATDRPVLNMGRTWRMGPEPEYLTVWYSPDHGLDRIDEWEEIFGAGEADAYEEPFRLAARIDRSGCYEPLTEPVPGKLGRYYAEWFDWREGTDRGDVVEHFETRASAHPDLQLNLLIDRIGLLGPDPRGLAVWGTPSWAALDDIAREDHTSEPVEVVTASFYADFGKETL